MKIVAGIDIGNATTETALAKLEAGKLEFLASGTVPTTGIKGTRQNINGIFHSLTRALEQAGLEAGHIADSPLCTACHPDLFWSHRSLGTSRGSMAAAIQLK